jgi:hypothetical protein
MDAAIRTAQSPPNPRLGPASGEPHVLTAQTATDSTRGFPGGLREQEILLRRRMIINWCDLHLTTIHALTALMTEDHDAIAAGLVELLAAPPGTTPVSGSDRPPAHSLSRDRCPTDATALDRVELALALLGDNNRATASRTLGLPERIVTARLTAGLRILFTPCHGRP